MLGLISQQSQSNLGQDAALLELNETDTTRLSPDLPYPIISLERDERMKLCGNLFERRNTVNQEMLQKYFRREACYYNQITYKNAARIYHCLKADLNENVILKSLKTEQNRLQQKRNSNSSINSNYGQNNNANANQVVEVPRINYENNNDKKQALQLAFSTLKFQKILEELAEASQLYGNYPEFKDEQSLLCTILFDYMQRKFQLRDKLIDEPLDNKDALVTQIEVTIHHEKTDLAAELAKNRIKEDALTIDELLPRELREVDHHKAELPLYCWANTLKIDCIQDIVDYFIANEDLTLVESKKNLDRKCFCIDAHCPNVLMFHYSLRDKITNHELVRTGQLVIQDKSSCLAPHTVIQLLSKKDDVVITNVSGGLVAAFVASKMEEYGGRVYVCGINTEDKYQEIHNKLQQIGCLKYVKLLREDFQDLKFDDARMENVKVILVNAPCSKSALMNPMDFLFEEGEDVKFLRDYTLDVANPNRIKKCIQTETAILNHALRFPKVRAIVYQTYSKNNLENENVVNKSLEDFNETRRTSVFPYNISPPCIPLTVDDIKNDEVVKNFKFLQFKASDRMNGCFIACMTRNKDTKVDKESRKAEQSIEKKAKLSAPQLSTFQEKNFLTKEGKTGSSKHYRSSVHEIASRRASVGKRSTGNIPPQQQARSQNRRKSLGKNLPPVPQQAFQSLENDIKNLQIRSVAQAQQQTDRKVFYMNQLAKHIETSNTNLANNLAVNNVKSKILISQARHGEYVTSFEHTGQLEQIENKMQPKRSSTPDEQQNRLNQIKNNK